MDTKYTKDQLLAIETRNRNILVSAGAGSGKTDVISARVLALLNEGVSIKNLLILTFTNAASHSMKEKIKETMLKNSNERVLKEYELVDSADITTFDSFYQKIVTKYFYKLGIKSSFSIIDDSLLKYETDLRLEKIILNHVDNSRLVFPFLDRYCLKDDSLLVDAVLTTYKKSLTKVSPIDYLDSLIKKRTTYDDILVQLVPLKEKLKSYIDSIEAFISKIDDDQVNYIGIRDKYNELRNIYTIEDNYDSYYDFSSKFFLTSFAKGKKKLVSALDEIYKEEFSEVKKQFSAFFNTLLPSKDYLKIEPKLDEYRQIVFILAKELYLDIMDYKNEKGMYTFNDIASFAVKLVQDEEVKKELKETYYEIMVDEYQDNNDIQEMFLNAFAQDNLFLVGDVKQSIYNFRNSNPSNFLNRFNSYSKDKNSKDFLISLDKNFRSHANVIDDINMIFDDLINLDFGGIDYKKDHHLEAKNSSIISLEEKPTSYYLYEIEKNVNSIEFEARIICEDIIKRINSKEKIGPSLKEIAFDDFALLCDRGTRFDIVAKVFEEYHIPIKIETDANNKFDEISSLIRSLFGLFYCLKDASSNVSELKYSLISLMRSPLVRADFKTIGDAFLKGDYNDLSLIKDMKEVIKETEFLSLFETYKKIKEKFNIYSNIKYFSKSNETLFLLAKYDSIIKNLSDLNYDYKDAYFYLKDIRDVNDYDFKIKRSKVSSNAVILTNMHKSKGLEYPICYFIGLDTKYKEDEYKANSLMLDDLASLSLEYVLDDFEDDRLVAPPSLASLYSREIGLKKSREEKIRLFYVGLTRAKYQMIFLLDKEKFTSSESLTLPSCKSFLNLLKTTSFIGQISEFNSSSIKKLTLNSYLKEEEEDYSFEYKELPSYLDKEEETRVASSSNVHVEDSSILDFGTKLHLALETLDLSNEEVDTSYIKDATIKKFVNRFLDSDLRKKYIGYNDYHEYEYYDDVLNSFGSIDLLLVSEKDAVIIDYKTKNISDEKYIDQLHTYQRNVKRIFNLDAKAYLYSIVEGVYKEVI